MTDIKNLIEEQNRLWNEAKDVNEKNLAENRRFKSEFNEKWDKINSRLNDIDETVQNVKAAQRPSAGGVVASEEQAKKSEYQNLFYKYVQQGAHLPESTREKMRGLQSEIYTKANILSGTDASGGFAVPENIAEMIMKTVAEKSPIRQFSTVLTISSGNSLKIPRATVATATWDDESTFPSSPWSPTVDQVTITPYNLNAAVKISRDALIDIPNINAIAVNALADASAVKEGQAFAVGDGTTSYGNITGLTNASGLNNKAAAGAAAVTTDELIDLAFGQTKPEYHANARWAFNKATLNEIRQLKNSDNQYLWQPIVDAMGAGRLLEFPYFIAADLPNMATGTKSIFFGDFAKGFYVVDREGLVVDRLLEKDYPLVDIVLRKRVAGGVVIPEALGHITQA